MPTLLLSRTCQPEADRLAHLAREARWALRWLKDGRLPTALPGKDLAFYGETHLARALVQNQSLALIEPTFDLLSKIPHCYTHRQIDFMTLDEAINLSHRAFVKPADCTNKCFDAAVCEAGSHIRRAADIPRSTCVLVSEPVDWEVEYRVIVLERTIATFSPYIRGGWLGRDSQGQWTFPQSEANEMLAFCRSFLADGAVPLPPAFTLDIGFIPQRGWAIVELNPVWCSGLLGCDLSSLLNVLKRVCRRKKDLTSADAKWVIDRDS